MTWVVWFDKLLPVALVVSTSVLSWRLGRASARVDQLLADVRPEHEQRAAS
jgi:hypothetical protein